MTGTIMYDPYKASTEGKGLIPGVAAGLVNMTRGWYDN